MSQIDRVVKRASARLLVVDLLRRLTVTLSAGVGVLLITLLAERLARAAIPWQPVLIAVPCAAVIVALAWTLLTRRRTNDVAREVAERADLRESLSTALLVRRREDGWSRAVVETAENKAAEVELGRAIPITPPRTWPVPVASAAALLLGWLLIPTIAASEADSGEREVRQVLLEQRENQRKLEELIKKARLDLGEEKAEFETELPKDAQTPEEIQRAMVKKLTKLTDGLRKSGAATKAEQLRALKSELGKLKRPGGGPLDEFSRKLAKGDFSGARKALEQLQKKLDSGDLTEAQKQQLKEQMENLAKQLDELAKMQDKLAEQLAQAGLTQEQIEQAMADPASMHKALEQMQDAVTEHVGVGDHFDDFFEPGLGRRALGRARLAHELTLVHRIGERVV